ncbi:MAG: hypothetical protein K6E54_00980 [Bacteroidaceae bacterium]|nr:hypothetical protein [Bacteroidaceae bacterium]
MKIIEQFIQGKREDQSLCEDALVVTADFAAVIDGSTSKGTEKYLVESTGRTASQLVKHVIESELQFGASLLDSIRLFNQRIMDIYDKYGVRDMVIAHPENRITCSAIIYSRYRKEVWQIGDCQCMMDGKVYDNSKPIEALMAEVRSIFYEMGLDKKLGNVAKDAGREYILPLLRGQTIFQNNLSSRYGYAVIDGIGNPESLSKILDVKEASEIVLASDGYPQIFSTLAESEKYLSDVLVKDPMCLSINKATKGLMPGQTSFDDRTYLKIQVE